MATKLQKAILSSSSISELGKLIRTGMSPEEVETAKQRHAELLKAEREAAGLFKAAGIELPEPARTVKASKTPRDTRPAPDMIDDPSFEDLAAAVGTSYAAVGGNGPGPISYVLAAAVATLDRRIMAAAAHVYAAHGAGAAHDARGLAVNGGHVSTSYPVYGALMAAGLLPADTYQLIDEGMSWIEAAAAAMRFGGEFNDGIKREPAGLARSFDLKIRTSKEGGNQ